MFPIWKITEKPCGLLLHPPGFDVNFFIMGIDVIYAAFRTDPVGSVFPCPEGPVGSVFPGTIPEHRGVYSGRSGLRLHWGRQKRTGRRTAWMKRECFTRALLSFSEGCFVKWESPAERLFVKRI